MNIGDLFDLLEEKLKTGEFSQMDTVYVVGGGDDDPDWNPITDVSKRSSNEVMIEIEAYIVDNLMGGSFI